MIVNFKDYSLMNLDSLMKSIAVSFAVLFLCIANPDAQAQEMSRNTIDRKIVQSDPSSGRYFDRRGSSSGRTEMRGTTTRLLDASGRNIGRVESRSGSSRLYSSSGSVQGRTESRGGQTRYFDASGRNQGRSQTSGTTTRFYSSSGAYEGRAETTGGTTRYFDRNGRNVGSKRPR